MKKPIDYGRIWYTITLVAYEYCAVDDEEVWSCDVARIEREVRTKLDMRKLDAHMSEEWTAIGTTRADRRYTYRFTGTTRAERRARQAAEAANLRPNAGLVSGVRCGEPWDLGNTTREDGA